MNFSPLSFSPVGEMQVTLVLSKTSSANDISPHLASPVGKGQMPLAFYYCL